MTMRRPLSRPTAQIPLDLTLEPRFGREDFLVGPSNEAAFEFVELWPNWPGQVLLLVGPEGSGKSHLAAIWAARSGARTLAAGALESADPVALAQSGAIVLEDADRQPFSEAALFHLLNLIRETGAWAVLTTRSGPDRWNLRTPDLLSRLRLAPATSIDPPDDALLRALIVKQFVDRQIIVDAGLIEYLLPRIERSFAGVARVVDTLDREGLAQGRRITRAIAAEVIGKLGGEG